MVGSSGTRTVEHNKRMETVTGNRSFIICILYFCDDKDKD